MAAKFNLAAWAKQRGKRRRAELRPIAARRATEHELRRIFLRVLAAGAESRAELLAAAEGAKGRLTRDDVRLDAAIRAMREAMGQLLEVARAMIQRLLQVEATRFDQKWLAEVNGALGIDLRGVITTAALADDIDLATQRNVSLIRGLTGDVAKRVETALVDMIVSGTSTREMAKALDASFAFGRSRAAFIARDQAAKFNGSLNRIRQQEAGVTEYVWWTVQDERVRGNPMGRYPNARPSHWDRHGKTFLWADAPSDGHPGDPVNCRCIARAVLE
jgi:SPP1 gp7 family putative phage head morphogenesis protein